MISPWGYNFQTGGLAYDIYIIYKPVVYTVLVLF